MIDPPSAVRIPPGVELSAVHELIRYGGRFGGFKRRWDRLIRPVRPRNLRNELDRARSVVQRSRYGIGPQDAWSLGGYLCTVAARGLRRRSPERADTLERWLRVSHGDGSEDTQLATEGAQGVLRWIAGNLDELDDVDPASSRAYVRSAIQRGRFGIAATDVALARHLSAIAARGMCTIADGGYSYPMNRVDEHEWRAELYRAADALGRWANTAEGHTVEVSTRAADAWLWIADNLEHLWD